MDRFVQELHATVHRSPNPPDDVSDDIGIDPIKPPDEIADDLGISYSMLCRTVLEGKSGATFDMRRYIPLLESTKNYRSLAYLAHHFGFLLVKVPQVQKTEAGNGSLMNAFQRTAAKTVELFLNFTEHPDKAREQEAVDALVEHIQQAAGLKVRVERYRQGDLFQDE